MRIAAYLVLASAGFHVIGCILSGFSEEGLFLLIPALLFIGLYAALMRQIRASAWLGLILMLGSAAAAIAEILTPSIIPNWIFWGILLANLAAATMLFGAIWAGPKVRPNEG